MATELAKAYVQIIPSADGITGSISKVLEGEADDAGKSAGKNIAASLTGAIGAGLAALGIGKIIGEAISAGTEYQTAIAKLGTIADTSALSMDGMREKIVAVSNEMGIAQKDLAEAAYSTISATGDTAGAMDIVAQASKLATAGFADTDSAISVLTTSLNAYGLKASDVDHISDSLITTQNLGVTTVAELAANMGRAIATASGYGVSLENLEAAYIGTTKSGISTAESTTYISSMMSELGKNGTNVSKILKESTGKSFAEMMNSGSSLADVLGVLHKSVNGNSEAFMNLWGSAEAGKAANALVNQGLDTFNENLSTLQNQTGTTQTAYEQMTDSFAWKTQNLQTQVQNLGIKLFESIYPVLEELSGMAMEFMENMDTEALAEDLSGFVQGIVPVISTLADVILKIGQHLDLLVPVISAIMGFGIASKLIGAVTGVMQLFSSVQALTPVIAALTGPIGLVITIVAGLVAGIVTLYKTNETFRNGVIAIWEAIKTAAVVVWNGLLTFLKGVLNGIKTVFVSVWNGIVSVVSTVWNTICNVVQTAIMLIGSILSGAFQIITLPFQMIWQNCSDFLVSAWNKITSFISDIIGKIGQIIRDFWTDTKVSFWEGGGGIAGILEAIMDTVINVVRNAFEIVGKIIGVDLSGIAEKIAGYMQKYRNFVVDLVTNIQNAIKNAINAIKTIVTNGLNAVKNIISTIFSKVKSVVSNVWNSIKTAISAAISGLKSVISTGLNAAKATVINVFNSIKSKISSVINAVKNVVASGINAIKNKFNFRWSLPKLKMPHFQITGKFSLSPPSVPKLGVEWYDKGGIFTGPQVIGVGEKRPEFVGALDDLRAIVREETGGGGSVGGEAVLQEVLGLLEQYLPAAASNKRLVLNTGAIAGELAADMDSYLGRVSLHKGRRN